MSRAMSALQIGKNNSQAGTIWICNLQTKENKKIKKIEPIPINWVIGRNKWKTLEPKIKRKPKIRPTQKYHNGYSVAVSGVNYTSISHAADCLGIGHETARMRFKSKSFPEYIILSR